MEAALNWLREPTALSTLVRLMLAALISGLIGNERGKHGRAAGMRTHILVCVGATLTSLVGVYAATTLGYSSDPLRVGAQVISGIGFLGAGTILVRDQFQVTGLTTAAGLWATAAVGLAIGIGYMEAAIFAALLVLAANRFLPYIENKVKSKVVGVRTYLEVSDASKVCELSEWLNAEFGVESLHICPARSGTQGFVGVDLELSGSVDRELGDICRRMMEREEVSFAVPIQ